MGSDRAAVAAPGWGTVLRGFSWGGAGHVISQLAWYASLVVLAAMLPPAALGTVSAALVIVSPAALLMGAGSHGSIVAAPDLDRRHLALTLARNISLGLLLTVGLAFAARPLMETFAEGSDVDAARALFATLAVTSFSIVPLAVLAKRMEWKREAAVRIGSSTAAAVTSIAAGLLGVGVWALVVRQLVLQALLAAFAWIAARDLLPKRTDPRPADAPRVGGGGFWFFVLAATDFVALSLDNLVVGAAGGATELGLYALAFTLGLAPLTQFSWQLGRVLFPVAAATRDVDLVGERTVQILRFGALFLLPLLPPIVVLAPVLIPTVLGSEWTPMVVPFSILVVVGAVHALVNVVGESLSGTGGIRFRALVNTAWAPATLVAVFVLVQLDGIRGAAIAHAIVVVPLAAAYAVWGARKLGTGPGAVWRALRPVVLAVIVQTAVTAAIAIGLRRVGAPTSAAAVAAAVVGVAVVTAVLLRLQASPLRDAIGLVAARRARSREAAGPPPAEV